MKYRIELQYRHSRRAATTKRIEARCLDRLLPPTNRNHNRNHYTMMKFIICIILSVCHSSFALQQRPLPLSTSIDAGHNGRRSFLGGLLGSTALIPLLNPEITHASTDDEELIDVYFGCGCVRFDSLLRSCSM